MRLSLPPYLHPLLEAGPHPDKAGWGVFAKGAIGTGELLAVWGGKIVGADAFAQLPNDVKRHSVQVKKVVSRSPGTPCNLEIKLTTLANPRPVWPGESRSSLWWAVALETRFALTTLSMTVCRMMNLTARAAPDSAAAESPAQTGSGPIFSGATAATSRPPCGPGLTCGRAK
jgi:hypothetical protein